MYLTLGENTEICEAFYCGVQKVGTQALLIVTTQNLVQRTELLSLKKFGLHLTYQIINEIESENVTF